ncbi:MAG: Dabb family protein [Pseudomonadota bacterium]
MREVLLAGSILALASCATSAAREAPNAEPLLTHAVFFDLKNDDATSIQALVDGCYQYLAPHDGIVYFSAGARHLDYQREVNDLGFDVALTIVFENTAAQDAYQVTEPHLQFIEEFNENWASVRVFDSLAPAVSE